jgi:hypothetical protein
MTETVPRLLPTQSDSDIAAEFKKELAAKITEVCTIMDRANLAGFEVAYTIGKQWHGKQGITNLVVAKHF